MTAARTPLLIALIAASLASGAAAQTKPDSETFLEAIEEQRNNDVLELVAKKGRAIATSAAFGATTRTWRCASARRPTSISSPNGADPTWPTRCDTAL